jgi:hypothetical protein
MTSAMRMSQAYYEPACSAALLAASATAWTAKSAALEFTFFTRSSIILRNRSILGIRKMLHTYEEILAGAHADQFIEFDLNSRVVTILRILNEKNH